MADALGFAPVRYTSHVSYPALVHSLHPNLQREFPEEAKLRGAVDKRLAALEG
jgi:hypothetical protein